MDGRRVIKAITIVALLAFSVSFQTLVLALEQSAKAVSVVHRYVKEHKHWKESDYRIKRDRTEDRYIVFLVTYLPEQKRFMVAGGGETFEAYYDPAKRRVIKEMHFQ